MAMGNNVRKIDGKERAFEVFICSTLRTAGRRLVVWPGRGDWHCAGVARGGITDGATL